MISYLFPLVNGADAFAMARFPNLTRRRCSSRRPRRHGVDRVSTNAPGDGRYYNTRLWIGDATCRRGRRLLQRIATEASH